MNSAYQVPLGLLGCMSGKLGSSLFHVGGSGSSRRKDEPNKVLPAVFPQYGAAYEFKSTFGEPKMAKTTEERAHTDVNDGGDRKASGGDPSTNIYIAKM